MIELGRHKGKHYSLGKRRESSSHKFGVMTENRCDCSHGNENLLSR